jgi:uncharacterized protein (TIGR02452 family)
MNRDIRVEIAKQTIDILERGDYINKNNKKVEIGTSLELAKKESYLYRPQDFKKLENEASMVLSQTHFDTTIEITNESTIDAVIRLSSINTACLNFASAKNPGGGFLNGSQAQEESLARATGLYPCINQMKEMYGYNRSLKTCLYSDYMIFSKQVPVIRDTNDDLLDEYREVSIITAPAVNTGVVRQREPENIDIIESTMQRRISMIFNIAIINQIDTLILGAWGCGVFQNDPKVVAQLFAEQINSKYKNAFKKIVFAIIDNPKTSTFEKFNQVFNNK